MSLQDVLIPLPNLSVIFEKFTEKGGPEIHNKASQHDRCKDQRNSKHLSYLNLPISAMRIKFFGNKN